MHVAYNASEMHTWLASLTCPATLLYGKSSHVGAGKYGAKGDVEANARAIAEAVKQSSLHALQSGHHLVEDAPVMLRDILAGCITSWSAAGLMDAGDASSRLPERLQLKPVEEPPRARKILSQDALVAISRGVGVSDDDHE